MHAEQEDVATRNGVQPYRFELRRRNNNDYEESDSGELTTLRYNTRIRHLLHGRFDQQNDRCRPSAQN